MNLRRPGARPGPRSGAGLLARILSSAPERLLLIFLLSCYAIAAAYVSGFFRPVVVVPTALVLVVLTWRSFPRQPAAGARTAIGSTLAVVVAGGWFALNVPYVAERVDVTRDPDIYTLAALWLVDHGSTDIPVPAANDGGPPGFSFQHGVLLPQGNHLVSGVAAALGWAFGRGAVFCGNLACGAAALLAVYVVARRLTGSFWALLPMSALAASLPMVAFSRGLYSEPLALTFTVLGAALLWSAWCADRRSGYLLTGLAFGGVSLARIDGSLPLAGVLGGLAIAALVDPARADTGRRWAAPLVLVGSLPGVVLGFLDLRLHTGVYLDRLGGRMEMLAALLVGVAVFAVALAFVRVPATWLPRIGRLAGRIAPGAAVLLAIGLVVLATRPWWYVSHAPVTNGIVAGIQEREGLPVDGTRMYTEDSVTWQSWYYGWPAVAGGFAGLLAWLVAGTRTRATHLLWLSALFLPSTVLYLTQPNITPDQIWAMRRFLPVVVPGLLLAGTWVARQLAVRGLFRHKVPGRVLAGALAASTLAGPVIPLVPMWTAQDKGGALAGNERVCARIDGRPTIVTGLDSYLPTILALCEVPALQVREPSQPLLARARAALGGKSVVLVTRIAPQKLPWADGHVPAELVYSQTLWAASVTGQPDRVLIQRRGIAIGLVQEDGSLTPVG